MKMNQVCDFVLLLSIACHVEFGAQISDETAINNITIDHFTACFASPNFQRKKIHRQTEKKA